MNLLSPALLGMLLLSPGLCLLNAQDGKPEHRYIPGFRTPRQVGLEMAKSLTPERRAFLAPDPVEVQRESTPFLLARTADPADPKSGGTVHISMGFIDLVNNLAHARAVDKIQKGYFEKYVLSLSQEKAESLKELPGLEDDKFWSEDVMNDQQTFFNQIAGTTIGIAFANHYLGHYAKYAPKMFEGGSSDAKQNIRIKNLLTADEWTDSVKAGVRNALDSVASVDGISMLLEAIEKMPKRPEWTACFVPDKDIVKLSKLRKDLKKVEEDFFSGK